MKGVQRLRIARYRHNNKEQYGIVTQQDILSLPALAKQFKGALPAIRVLALPAEGRPGAASEKEQVWCHRRNDIFIGNFHPPLPGRLP